MYLPIDKAVMVLSKLLEGNSIRSIQRIPGIEKKTILKLLVLAGEKSERLLNDKIKDLAVRDVQADEMLKKKGVNQQQHRISPLTIACLCYYSIVKCCIFIGCF